MATFWKDPVRAVETTKDIDVTTGGTSVTIDGISSFAVDDRVLLFAQTTSADNGVWLVKSGSWVRAADAAAASDLDAGATIYATDGTVYRDIAWRQTAPSPGGFDDLRFARCEHVYNVMQFGARGDVRSLINCTVTNGSASLSHASGNFTDADVGKHLLIRAPWDPVSGTVETKSGSSTVEGTGTTFDVDITLNQTVTIDNNGILTEHVVTKKTDDEHIDVTPVPTSTGTVTLYREITSQVTWIHSLSSGPPSGTAIMLGPPGGSTVNSTITSTAATAQFGTDDDSAFQAALSAAGAAGGGRVEVPAGSYYLGSKITIPSHVTLSGVGRDATLLRAAPNWTRVDGEGMVEMRGAVAARLCDLTLDQGADGRTGGGNSIDHTLVCAATQSCAIERVRFINAGIAAPTDPTNQSTPSGPILLLVAKDAANDIGGQFGTVPYMPCAGNIVRDCEFSQSASVRIAKGVALITDFGLIPPLPPDPDFDPLGFLTTISGAVAIGASTVPIANPVALAPGNPARIERAASPALYDLCLVSAAGTPITLANQPPYTLPTRTYSTGDKIGRAKGYAPAQGGFNLGSLRSRLVDSGGDAFVNHVEGNTIESCTFRGAFVLFTVGVQGGGTRHNHLSGCRFDSVTSLSAVLIDKGAYGNDVGRCVATDQTRDRRVLLTSSMEVFACRATPEYQVVDNSFHDCQVTNATGTSQLIDMAETTQYDCAFGVGPYAVRCSYHNCSVFKMQTVSLSTGSNSFFGAGFVVNTGNTDLSIAQCAVSQADYGIVSNSGGPLNGSGGAIESCVMNVARQGIAYGASSGVIDGTVRVVGNRVTCSAGDCGGMTGIPCGTVAISDTVQAAQLHDNHVESTATTLGSNHAAIIFGPLTGSADGNHVKNAYTAYLIGASFAGHWGERNHATGSTIDFAVVSGATFVPPAGSGRSFSDIQHGTRSGGGLHHLASLSAHGFMSTSHFGLVSNAAPNNFALTLVLRDASGNFNAQVVTVADLKHGNMVLALAPIGAFDANAAYDFAGSYAHSTGASARADFPIPLKQGDRVKSIAIDRYGPGSGTLTFRLIRLSGGTRTDLGNVGVSNPAASWNSTTLDPTDETVDAGEVFLLTAEMSVAGMRIGSIRVTYDRP